MNVLGRIVYRRGLFISGMALGLFATTLVNDAVAQTGQEKSGLPSDYRQYAARATVFWYIVKSKGPATISEKQTPAGKDLCISYPVPKLGLFSAHPTETEPLTFKVHVGRSTFGQRIFLMSSGGGVLGELCAGPSKPFHELNKLAAEVKACRTKGGGDCGGGPSEIFRAMNEFKNLP